MVEISNNIAEKLKTHEDAQRASLLMSQPSGIAYTTSTQPLDSRILEEIATMTNADYAITTTPVDADDNYTTTSTNYSAQELEVLRQMPLYQNKEPAIPQTYQSNDISYLIN